MPDTLGGLPAHPLLVHLPVVLLPLAAICAIALAVRPAWLRTFGWFVVGISGVGFLGALLAASTGESLEDTRRASGETISATLRDHAEQGDAVQVYAAIFFFLVLAWVLFAWWRRRAGEERATAVVRKPRVLATTLAALAIIAGVVSTVSVTITGHNGAKSVWESDK